MDKKPNFQELLMNCKVSKWTDIAESDELLNIFKKEGFAEYMKQYKQKLAEAGFYKKWFK